RFTVDVTADERALHEVYLPHFRRVAAAGVASTMSAYNSVNGNWCGENEALLTEILRDEWSWDGFVISDFIFGLRDAAASVRAGLDIEMPFRQQRAVSLADALVAGELEDSDIDRCVERIVATLLRFARVVEQQPAVSVIGSLPHRALAREASAATTVLLRNEGGLLPIEPADVGRLAVVGRLADVPNLGDGGSSDVKATTTVTPLMGLRAAFPEAEIEHSVSLDDDAARTAVAAADLVVLVVGYTKEDEGEFIDNAGTMALAGELFPPMDHPELGFVTDPSVATVDAASPDTSVDDATPHIGGESDDAAGPDVAGASAEISGDGEESGMSRGGDRSSLRLRRQDEALIEAAVALNDRVVVVMQCGSAVVTPWADTVPAVLYGWYPGVEGGNGLADVLTGAAEPGGRLPFAVPTDEAHLPDFDATATAATYDLVHGQWMLDRDGVAPHFPFGWGLSYTRWSVDSVAVSTVGSGVARVEATVTNVGERVGSTVVFVHAGLPGSAVDRPSQRLIGFTRVVVAAGSSQRVGIELDWHQLDVRRDGGWWTEPGEYRLWVGQHAGDRGAQELVVAR
ncbi:MAG: glycoside hydrolase family 3 C-terminal domain-containing protein, partial [Actinomycetota bacterium]